MRLTQAQLGLLYSLATAPRSSSWWFDNRYEGRTRDALVVRGLVAEVGGKWVLTDAGQEVYSAERRRGQPRKHTNNAEKQAAYRERRRLALQSESG